MPQVENSLPPKDCAPNGGKDCAHKNECTSGNFRCRDGTCVSELALDFMLERVECLSSHCPIFIQVSLRFVCDGAPNCPDGSDEDTNSTCIPGVVPCRENGLPCQHLCVATAAGHFCACKEGYRKGSDGRSCIDIDECQIGPSLSSEFDYWQGEGASGEHSLSNMQVCSQICANSVPGFQCSCSKGYHLRPDKRRCKASQGPEAMLITANGDHFR